MCGRTSLAVAMGVLMERFDAEPAAGVSIQPRYNLAPRDDLVVIQSDAPEEMDLLQWGFLPQWADSPDATPRPINARSETASEKPMFRDAFENRRCLILQTGSTSGRVSMGRNSPTASYELTMSHTPMPDSGRPGVKVTKHWLPAPSSPVPPMR